MGTHRIVQCGGTELIGPNCQSSTGGMAKSAEDETTTFADMYNSMSNAADDALGVRDVFPNGDEDEFDDRVSLLAFEDDPKKSGGQQLSQTARLGSILCCVAGLRAACQVVLVASETSIVPYFTANGVPISVAGLVFMISPVVCFGLNSWVQQFSPSALARYKEKRAYIVVFTLAAVAVLIVLTQLELIREKYGWQNWLIATFVMFGLAEVGIELLMRVGDAILLEASGEESLPHHVVQVTDLFAAVGRMGACLMGSLPVENVFPIFHGWDHMRSLFVVATVVLVGASATLVASMSKDPSSEETTKEHKESQSPRNTASATIQTSGAALFTSMEGKLSDRGNAALQLLWISTLIGRMLVLELWLYWTMWIGYDAMLPGTSLRLGCLGLTVQGLSSVLTGLALEWVEHRVHDFRLTFFGALLCTAASMSCLAATQWSNSAYLLLSFFSGCGSAVLTHSPRCITWRVLAAEDVLDQYNVYLRLVDSGIPISRVAVALSGVIVWGFFDGQVGWFFAFTGTLALVVLGVLVVAEFHFGWLLEYTDKAKAQPKKKGNIGNH